MRDDTSPLAFAFKECPIYQKMRAMHKAAETRSKAKGRVFDITLQDILPLYVERCPILGIDLKWDNKDKLVWGSPSLDRVDNSRGYEKNNVQIISHRANTLKKDYLLTEWQKMTEYMQSGGGLITISDQHFKTEAVEIFTEEQLLHLKRARKRGETIEEIADGMMLPISAVARYISQVEPFYVDF